MNMSMLMFIGLDSIYMDHFTYYQALICSTAVDVRMFCSSSGRRLKQLVIDSWNEAPVADSNAMIKMMKKLKYLKENIRKWNKMNTVSPNNSKRTLKAELADLNSSIDKGDGDEDAINKRTNGICDVIRSMASEQNRSGFCGTLHGLVINWSGFACASFLLVKLAMSPFAPKKFRMGVAIATGRRGYYKPGTRAWVSRISLKIRIPISMYPCRVEERLTIELAEGREVEKIVTTVTKNGVVTRYPGKFQEYQLTNKEKEMEKMMIYWEQVEYEVSDDDDSDLKSTIRSVPKDYELEDTGDSSGI
ncbi:hypothetical protein Tco_0453472 [Tanacetum coccineum]